MGNWRTVHITGTMSARHAEALRDYLGYTHESGDAGWERFGPLSFRRTGPSLCGLNAWPAETMDVCGNLAERDYPVESVAETLRELVRIAPTMLLKVHCGGDWESDDVVATISVGEGLVVVGKPEVARLPGIPEMQIVGNFFQNLARS